jgi:excisionase family DNA binding protein
MDGNCGTSARNYRTHKATGKVAAMLEAKSRTTMNPQTAIPPSSSATASGDEILEKAETALRLKISTRTLDEWMRKGRVPFLKIGKTVRFRWCDVVAHLDHNCRVN